MQNQVPHLIDRFFARRIHKLGGFVIRRDWLANSKPPLKKGVFLVWVDLAPENQHPGCWVTSWMSVGGWAESIMIFSKNSSRTRWA